MRNGAHQNARAGNQLARLGHWRQANVVRIGRTSQARNTFCERGLMAIQRLLADHLFVPFERLFTSRDMALIAPTEPALRPDIWVATISLSPIRTQTVVEPSLVIHFLREHPDNQAKERARIEKFGEVSSLRELLVVNTARRKLEGYRRQSPDTWIMTNEDDGTHVFLETIDLQIRVADVWTPFDSADDASAIPSRGACSNE